MHDRRLVSINYLHAARRMCSRQHQHAPRARVLPKRTKHSSGKRWCAASRILAILLASFALPVLAQRPGVPPEHHPRSGATAAIFVTVAIDSSRPVATFSPSAALGAGVDGHGRGALRDIYTPQNIAAMRSAGLGRLTYRLRTELGIEAWHWNPNGRWSDSAHSRGYWISDSASSAPDYPHPRVPPPTPRQHHRSSRQHRLLPPERWRHDHLLEEQSVPRSRGSNAGDSALAPAMDHRGPGRDFSHECDSHCVGRSIRHGLPRPVLARRGRERHRREPARQMGHLSARRHPREHGRRPAALSRRFHHFHAVRSSDPHDELAHGRTRHIRFPRFRGLRDPRAVGGPPRRSDTHGSASPRHLAPDAVAHLRILHRSMASRVRHRSRPRAARIRPRIRRVVLRTTTLP